MVRQSSDNEIHSIESYIPKQALQEENKLARRFRNLRDKETHSEDVQQRLSQIELRGKKEYQASPGKSEISSSQQAMAIEKRRRNHMREQMFKEFLKEHTDWCDEFKIVEL